MSEAGEVGLATLLRLFARRSLDAVATGVRSEARMRVLTALVVWSGVRLFARRSLDAVATGVMSEAMMCVLTALMIWSSLRLFARHSLDAVATGVMSEAMMSFLTAVVVWSGLRLFARHSPDAVATGAASSFPCHRGLMGPSSRAEWSVWVVGVKAALVRKKEEGEGRAAAGRK